MITAAEKHIFTFHEIRAGNLQAEDLTSSLWLIVELTEKVTTDRQQPCYTLPSAQARRTPTTISATMRDITHFEMTLELHS